MARPNVATKHLKSQKDGRRFAIRTLKHVEQAGDDAMALSKDWDAIDNTEFVVRSGPQSDVLLRALDLLHTSGSRDAMLGFVAVLTDRLHSGSYTAPEQYEKWERAGRLEDMRASGVLTN